MFLFVEVFIPSDSPERTASGALGKRTGERQIGDVRVDVPAELDAHFVEVLRLQFTEVE